NSDEDYQEKMNSISNMLMEYIESLGPEGSASFMEDIQKKMQEYYAQISKDLERSSVHRILISNGEIEYKAGGSVPGNVLNQFSMDEHNGYFRIATTTSGWVGGMRGKTLNHVYILGMDMNIAGSLENLAEDESIYSVRFMGDRGYMVTFRRVDPLFVIDLSDPASPAVLGKLKIPGYSDYLHPYDDSHLIGVGMETEEIEGGRVITTGVKLSLFDVTDVGNPKEISKYVIGGKGSHSYALQDHKAFLFNKNKELLVIPARVSDWSEDKGWRDVKYTDGAQVFKINLEDGFVFKGEVTHQENETQEEEYYYPRYDKSVKRSLYIDNVLYTLSEDKIKLNSLDDLSGIKDLIFGE
ncbi:MAG: beta-propeller domain-containing protein, partial [Candidatus Aenigmarchaeota archaeon]